MKWYDFVLIAILSVMIWPFAMMVLMANFLKQQFRMRKEICELINPFMYHGQLITADLKLKQDNFPIIPEINKNILIVDTSKIFPFAQKKGTSYYNLMHAIAARNLIRIISALNIKGKKRRKKKYFF